MQYRYAFARWWNDNVERPEPRELLPGIKLMTVYHCGRRMRNTHRPDEDQRRDWQRVGAVVSRLRAEQGG
jgi:hypothetical protein